MLRVNNLVGFGAGRRLKLAYKDEAISSAATIAWPSTAAGDIAFLADYARNAVAPAPSTVNPSGFTELDNINIDQINARARLIASARRCDGTETGNITGMTGTNGTRKILILWSGGAASINAGTWNGEMTAVNPSSQSILASGGNAPLIAIGIAVSAGFVADFTTETPAFEDKVLNDFNVGYTIYNSGPGDHTVDMADNGDLNGLMSGWIEAV